MFRSFQLRFSIIVLLVLLPVVILIFWMGETQRGQLIEDAQQDALALAKAIGNEYHQYLESGHDLLKLLAQLPLIRNKRVDACQAVLADLIEENPVYNGMFVVDAATGLGLCFSQPVSQTFDNRPYPWYQAVLDTQDFVVSDFRLGPESGRPIVTMGYPVLDEQGDLTAVVAASLSLNWLNTFAETSLLPPDASFIILDRDGTVLIRYPQETALVGQPFPVAEVRQAILTQPQGVMQATGHDNIARIYAYDHITPESGDIHVLVGIPESIALADADYVQERSFVVLSGIIVIGVVVAWISGTVITRPIHDLEGAIRRLASGDLSSRMDLQTDVIELQRLLSAFNAMATVIETRTSEQVEQLTQANQERQALLEAERRALEDAEQALDELSQLQAVSDALALAVSVEDVSKIIAQQSEAALGAASATVQLFHREDNTFEMVYTTSTLPEEQLALWRRYPAAPGLPVTDVQQNNHALWFASAEEREARFPAVAQFSARFPGASVILPLAVEGQVAAAVGLMFTERREFSQREQQLIDTIMDQCAQALERVRLAEKARELAVLEERQRLARELHDAVTQTLFSASVVAETLPRLYQQNPERAFEQLEQLHMLVRGASAEMRTLLLELRPENVVKTSLTHLIRQLCQAVQAQKQIAISVAIRGDEDELLPPDIHIALYRITQESLNNILKHGNAAQARIRLNRTPERVELVIVDNGQGFDTKRSSAGLGLTSMRERCEGIDATIRIQSKIGFGTRIKVAWQPDVRRQRVML